MAGNEVPIGLWIPSANFSGSNSCKEDATDAPFFQCHVKEEVGDEYFDICLAQAGRKRRLTATQVQFLERNFELENKLEPERKIQIAKELGLRPRQVAIWFQNRRARSKNKQLELDYGSLKDCYDKLKTDYDNLLEENTNMKNEVLSLRDKLSIKDKLLEDLKLLDTINYSPLAEQQNLLPNSVYENVASYVPVMTLKQDDSTSSVNLDSDSSLSIQEPTDSWRVLEAADQSDFSQDEDDILSRSFLPPLTPCFAYASSCTIEFPVEDQSLWSWTY